MPGYFPACERTRRTSADMEIAGTSHADAYTVAVGFSDTGTGSGATQMFGFMRNPLQVGCTNGVNADRITGSCNRVSPPRRVGSYRDCAPSGTPDSESASTVRSYRTRLLERAPWGAISTRRRADRNAHRATTAPASAASSAARRRSRLRSSSASIRRIPTSSQTGRRPLPPGTGWLHPAHRRVRVGRSRQ